MLLAGCKQYATDSKYILFSAINGTEQDMAEVAKAAETTFNGSTVLGW